MIPNHAALPVPDLDDPLFAPFWEGTRSGILRTMACTGCGADHWPPRHYCVHCGGFSMTWKAHTGRGVLYSWTVVHKPTAKGFAEVPYAVLIVGLEDAPGVRIVGNLAGNDFSALEVGLALQASFVRAGPEGEIHLVQWEPVLKKQPTNP